MQRSRLSSPAAILLALLAACDQAPDLGTMRVEAVHRSLVADDSAWEVLAEHGDHAVRLEALQPWTANKRAHVAAPSLLLTPPAKVKLKLGESDDGALLRFRYGFGREAYAGSHSGEVSLRVLRGEQAAFEATLPFGESVEESSRAWGEVELSLAGTGDWVLQTELVGTATGAPPFGVSGLDILDAEPVPRGASSVDQPNVVLVVMDTLRADRLGCYGYERPLTPNLDALAASGTLFEEGYSSSPWTWPSTASILTGLAPPAHGVVDPQSCYLAHELQSAAEAFQRAGWTTGGFSTNPLIRTETDFDQGFEEFHAHDLEPTREVWADIEEWIAAQGDRRFFLYLQLVDPHEYLPAPELLEQWGKPEPNDFDPALWMSIERSRPGAPAADSPIVRDYVDYYSGVYDATVAEADQVIGHLIAALEAHGHGDDTVIAFTSDHGEEFHEHGQVLHAKQLYDESVRVPLIIAGPGVPAGVRRTARVENRHLAPTLLALTGIERTDNLRGFDLLDQSGYEDASAQPVFCSTKLGRWMSESGKPVRRQATIHSVRFNGLLFIWNPEPPEGESGDRLFDLATDRDAHSDVAQARPEDCERLRELIIDWLERGEARRPRSVSGGESSLELLRRLGYIGQ